MVLLVNPQWRETRDAYDTLGGREGLLGAVGNFLGGTSGAQRDLAKLGFQDVYLAQQFVVRGDDCQLIWAYPYPNWVVYSTVRGYGSHASFDRRLSHLIPPLTSFFPKFHLLPGQKTREASVVSSLLVRTHESGVQHGRSQDRMASHR